MAFKLTNAAESDLISIYLAGAETFGNAQADAYHAELGRLFEALADNPRMARERTEFKPPVRIHPHKAHVIIYTIDAGNDVLIIRIRHGREDWLSEEA